MSMWVDVEAHPHHALSLPELDELELILNGAMGVDAFQATAPLTLPPAVASAAVEAQSLLLTDTEGTPVARLRPDASRPDERGNVFVWGPVSALQPLARASHGGTRLSPDALRTKLPNQHVIAFAFRGAPAPEQLDHASHRAQRGQQVLLVGLIGAGSPYRSDDRALMQYLVAAANSVPRALVLAVPLPAHHMRLAAQVLRRYGADEVVLPPFQEPDQVAPRRIGGQPGGIVLLTGLSGSGKSTLARELVERVESEHGRLVTLLDGDEVRRMLSSELGFSRADRELNVRRIGYVASLVARHGGLAVCAPIAPYASGRAEVRTMAEAVGHFVMVHVSTPLEVCEARDRKGLYARARAGLLTEFTGVSDPYETPTDADLVIDTSATDTDVATQLMIDVLVDRGLLDSDEREGARR